MATSSDLLTNYFMGLVTLLDSLGLKFIMMPKWMIYIENIIRISKSDLQITLESKSFPNNPIRMKKIHKTRFISLRLNGNKLLSIID